MSDKPTIWIIDTSIFLNILDVPGFNQNRAEVLKNFRARIENEDSFLLPFTSILETGNHIAHLSDGNQRRRFTTLFAEQVKKSLVGEAPWKPLGFSEQEELMQWLNDFPDNATKGIGLGDHIIIKQWEKQCKKFGAYIVKIWSLDSHLQGYECNLGAGRKAARR